MFLTTLEMKPTKKSGEWELTQELHYANDDGVLIRVPKGFKTDLASIPRFFRLLIQVNGQHRYAAVLHDYLYSKKGKLLLKNYDRPACDWLFFKAMYVSGVPVWKARLMYYGVRFGGWVRWGKV